jgi:hypothetical protein
MNYSIASTDLEEFQPLSYDAYAIGEGCGYKLGDGGWYGYGDLTATIKSKRKQTKNMKRRLAGWVKGSLANALHYASQRRGALLVLVNSAYTSQLDSTDGTLSGHREGDRFYRANGDVLDADQNAARNILARRTDYEISLWTPYQEVRSILQRRTEQRLGLLNQDSSCSSLPRERQRRAKC